MKKILLAVQVMMVLGVASVQAAPEHKRTLNCGGSGTVTPLNKDTIEGCPLSLNMPGRVSLNFGYHSSAEIFYLIRVLHDGQDQECDYGQAHNDDTISCGFN